MLPPKLGGCGCGCAIGLLLLGAGRPLIFSLIKVSKAFHPRLIHYLSCLTRYNSRSVRASNIMATIQSSPSPLDRGPGRRFACRPSADYVESYRSAPGLVPFIFTTKLFPYYVFFFFSIASPPPPQPLLRKGTGERRGSTELIGLSQRGAGRERTNSLLAHGCCSL